MPNSDLFDSTKTSLQSLLDNIIDGRVQLPDFQRGWVWDDAHIKSLLVSIARGFPIGSIMLLEMGGDARFQIRPIEGVQFNGDASKAERLILDGQQRLTSLIQVLRLMTPVATVDHQKRPVQRYYYIDIDQAMKGSSYIEDAIIGVDETKKQTRNFGREIILDLGTSEDEFAKFYFPCNQILNSDTWEMGLLNYDSSKIKQYFLFREQVLLKFRLYSIPVIELSKQNSKEAVCLVFEKVNTGGVSLSVFELVTASYAADGFNLRTDWYESVGLKDEKKSGRKKQLDTRPLLQQIEPTDFLQGISLLHTYDQRRNDIQSGKAEKESTTISAKREQVLSLPLSAYKCWANPLTNGFFAADKFLHMEGLHDLRFLPYQTQLVPLAVVMVLLGDRWLEPVIKEKLTRWYWCGVFGELYGSAIETRIALDVQGLMAWIEQPGMPEPVTVAGAGFQQSRLDTLRTRTSAAYRGLYVLLQQQGAQDFFWKADLLDLDYGEYAIDIHHIFPRAWCKAQGIPERTYNSIINKTAISYKANRMIGGKAPSTYLEQLRSHTLVQISIDRQDKILETHLISPAALRADNFNAFYDQRKQDLLALIELAMGKRVVTESAESPADDADDDEVPDVAPDEGK